MRRQIKRPASRGIGEKSVISCSVCGHLVTSDNTFCPECGVEFDGEEIEEVIDMSDRDLEKPFRYPKSWEPPKLTDPDPIVQFFRSLRRRLQERRHRGDD